MQFVPMRASGLEEGFQGFDQATWVTIVVTWLVLALGVYIAAKLIGEREGFLTALLAALVADIVYVLVLFLLHGVLGLILAIILAAAVMAGFYRTRWVRGLIIGILGILIATLINWLLVKFVL